MDLDVIIAKKEEQLYQTVLMSVSNPEVRKLVEEIIHLKAAKEIARESIPPITSSVDSGSTASPRARYMSRGSMALEILKAAGRPMHASEIVERLKQYSVMTTTQNIIGIIDRDRRDRFVRTGKGIYDVNPTPNPGRVRKSAEQFMPPGFSLIESIKALLPEMNGEFTQQDIYDLLSARYPDIIPYIQRASISKMLARLEKRGFLEMTFMGFGTEPKRFKVRSDGVGDKPVEQLFSVS